MKKAIVPMLGLLTVSCLAGFNNKYVRANATANVNGWDYDVELSGHPEDSPFQTCWSADTRSMRLSEQAAMFSCVPAYGTRGRFKSTYDLSSLDFTVEMSHFSNLVVLTIGKVADVYFSEGNMVASIDILPAKSNKIDGVTNSYIVCLSATQNNHNISIDGFNDGTDWPDDNHFQGVMVSPSDNRINIKFDRISEESTEVSVNNKAFTVSNATLYQNLVSSGLAYNSPTYVMVGGMNGSGQEKLVFEKMTDDAHNEYYSATGAYGVTKTALTELSTASLTTTSEAEAFLAKYKTLRYNELESYDKAYLKDLYKTVNSKYSTAIELSPTYMLEQRVEDLKTAYVTIKTKDDISNVESAIKAVQKAYDEIDQTKLTDTGKAVLENATNEMALAKEKVGAVAVKLYNDAADAYIKAVDAVKDAETLIAAKNAYSNIPSSYEKYFTEEALASVKELVNAALEKFTKMTRSDSKNITQGDYADTLVLDDNSLVVSAKGATQYGNKKASSGIYFEKEVAYSNFELKFSIDKLEADNTWIAFGIMEQPDIFIIAEDDSVTNNKGISFRIQRSSLTSISVEIYLTTLTATRYYDAKLLVGAEIPFAQDVTLKMKNVTKNLGGILDNYYSISFNDVEIGETIKASKLRTIFPNGDNAYLFFGSLGSEVAYTIKEINGKAPLSDDLKPASSVPTSSVESLEYVLGSGEDLSVNLDTKGEIISSVKVGKKVIATSNYSYENNTLTIKASALSKLAEGEQTLTIETAFGSVSWKLVVKTSGGTTPTDPDQPEESKGGCGGSVIATSAIASTLALAGVGLVLLKKKEDK